MRPTSDGDHSILPNDDWCDSSVRLYSFQVGSGSKLKIEPWYIFPEKERQRIDNRRNRYDNPNWKHALYGKVHFHLVAKTPQHCEAIRIQQADIFRQEAELKDITLRTYDSSIQGYCNATYLSPIYHSKLYPNLHKISIFDSAYSFLE